MIINKGIRFRETREHNEEFQEDDTVLAHVSWKFVLSPDLIYQNAGDSEGSTHEH